MLGYVPLGIPCGILCISAGMDLWMIAVMSVFFYSGAGQYMIPNMWLAANPASAIIASVNLVSSRQMLYDTSLAHFCKDAGSWLTFLFGATVTDESFGVNLGRFSTNPTWSVRDALLVNLFSQASWTLANMLGALIGTALSIPTAMASFAMTALFICLLCMQKLTRANVVAAIMAAAGVIICKVAGLTGPAILMGAVCGVAFGTIFDKRGEDADATGEQNS